MLCNIKQFVLFRRGKCNWKKATSHVLFLIIKQKTSHLRKNKTQQKRRKKNQCNAGQPQVPGRGRKVSREGTLMMKLLVVVGGHLINLLFAGFKLTAPPCPAVLLSVFPNPTSLQMFFFLFSVQRTIEQMLRCLRLFFVLNECFFSFIWYQWYACSDNFYRRSWKATCFDELLLWVVHKDLTVYSQFADLSWGGHVEDNKRALCWKPVSYPTLLMLHGEQHCICDFGRTKIGTFCSCFYTQKSW